MLKVRPSPPSSILLVRLPNLSAAARECRHPLHDTIQAKQQALLGWDAEGACCSELSFSFLYLGYLEGRLLYDTIQAWKAKQQALLGWDAEGANLSHFW